ncbi:2,5-dichloro-2,5-cyclohexadiene-1,4-diol dehydrogenase [Paenibacillus sp. J31TS4]|uniref:SDR family NAD(P)-dependent oxidoreductase n=1 Tax=Paenibacillus sp. J31TS4 TaxID=2807195 RepID=UPI001B2B8CDA|nr:SDR family NAD(P)-dependent oxidoreductase [Paenibacillus sp. J31TS4]GIP37383.1 2,5-dichloro-2,5-cyclohexadiene-1,4-diol dehydrogenase [Paenibacillus sp. J31TS4]
MGKMTGKVAIVTGAAGGMGKADAMLLAQEGAKVVITDIQEEKAQQVVQEIKENGGEAIGFKQNVASEEDWVRVVEGTIEAFGKIDVLVNNAGISGATPMLEMTLEQWDRIMSINLTGTFLGQKHVIPHMQKNGGGSIVNISSIAGLTGGSGAGAYTASKGAVRMLTKATAVDFAKDNIRVNSVHPGFIKTPMTVDLMNDEKMRGWFLSMTPIPRLGEAEDIAKAVLFLASDDSSYITGIEIPVDGGYSAK